MITKEKMLWSFSKLSQRLYKEMYEYLCGEFVCGYWGLQGWINYKTVDEEPAGCQRCILEQQQQQQRSLFVLTLAQK